MHTYKGKQFGRSYDHYLASASRTASMTDLERTYRRRQMEMTSYGFDDEQIETATTPVSEQDDPWE
jgi:hypothetical protein